MNFYEGIQHPGDRVEGLTFFRVLVIVRSELIFHAGFVTTNKVDELWTKVLFLKPLAGLAGHLHEERKQLKVFLHFGVVSSCLVQ